MSDFNRRKILKSSAGLAAAAALGVGTAIFTPLANAPALAC